MTARKCKGLNKIHNITVVCVLACLSFNTNLKRKRLKYNDTHDNLTW